LPLTAKDKYGETHSGWIVPKNDPSYSWESEAFIVVNDGAGYQYEPQTLSPTARPIQYFWHGVAESEWLCGPQLSYRKGEQRQHFDVDVDQEGFDAHRLPSGELLIKVGPRVYNSAFGSGTCGACPRTELRILRLGTDMKIREVLRLGSIVDDGTGAAQDFAVSPDWTQVIQYDQDGYGEQGKAGAWSSTTWCFSESEYQKCDNKRDVKPPEPPVLKELRNPD